MKVRDIATSRLRHNVLEAGVGGRPLLVLHGFGGAKEDFADVVDGFADRGWHVVVPDLRGHGASDHPEGEEAYTLPAMAEDALALADALGWERFALLGHSMGGMVAQLVALDDPGRLVALVLMDTGHGPVEGLDPAILELAVAVVRTEGVERLAELSAELDTRRRPPAEERVRAERPGYVEFGDRKLKACSAAMYAAMALQLPVVPDRLDALAGLRVPTLVVVGEQDKGFLAPSERLAATIPGAAYEVIADAAHAPQFENPDRWWRVVSHFLDAATP